MRLVILESPFAGDIEANVTYARACVRDSLMRGEAPIASHLLYTQAGILDDTIAAERQQGIDAGLAWRAVAQASVVYTDRGISAGMRYGIAAARQARLPVEFRALSTVASPQCESAAFHMVGRDGVKRPCSLCPPVCPDCAGQGYRITTDDGTRPACVTCDGLGWLIRSVPKAVANV